MGWMCSEGPRRLRLNLGGAVVFSRWKDLENAMISNQISHPWGRFPTVQMRHREAERTHSRSHW